MLLFFEIQLKSGCILGIMVLVYYIFLSKDTSFLRNRVWLLSSFVLPWCIPMLVMPIGLKGLLFGTKHVIHGIPIVNNNINNVATIIEVDNGLVSLETSVLSVYIAISIYLLIRLFLGYISIISFRKNSEIKSYKGFRLRIIKDDSVIPFSFFRTIYVSRSIEDRQDINMILDHEATHCYLSPLDTWSKITELKNIFLHYGTTKKMDTPRESIYLVRSNFKWVIDFL